MARKKNETVQEESIEESTVAEQTAPVSAETQELITKLHELEAKVKAGEEAALKRVCKALGIDPADVPSEHKPAPEMMIECIVPTQVNINGKIYLGKVVVSKGCFEVIQQALGDRKMRILRELVGTKYLLEQVAGGAFVPRAIGKFQEEGNVA